LKALRASAEAAVLTKDGKHNVDHNCLCQPILTEGQASTILGSGMTPGIELIH
jgi:hypothetical protein